MLGKFDEEGEERFRNMFGPGQIDSQVRSLINMCWMTLPSEKKTIDELERIFRHIVDRAFRDLREDRDIFGLPG